MRILTRRVVAVAAAICGVALAVAVVPDTATATTDVIGVGDSAIANLDAGIATAYDATNPAAPYVSENGPGWPQTCDAGLSGPIGSTYQVVRCVRPPRAGNTDYFIPFAKDYVGWSAFTGGNAPANLTTAELKGIYNCTYTTWNSLPTDPTSSTDTIHVYVPQAGSDVRAFFLSALGITATSEPCWQSVTPVENEGTDPVFANDKDAVFPYSLGHYVGQVYDGKGTVTDAPGVLDALRSIDGVTQIDTTNKVINANLPAADSRTFYHVVTEAEWNDATEGPRLKALLAHWNPTTQSGGWLCSPSGASLITSYGYLALAGGCGTLIAGT